MKCHLVMAIVKTACSEKEINLISDDGKNFIFEMGDFSKEFRIDEFMDALERLRG